MKYKAMVVDDESNMRSELERLLTVHCPCINICFTAGSTSEALAVPECSKADFAFLNISMPGAVDFYFRRSSPCQNLGIIFITSHQGKILRALTANALDFLLKPFNPVVIKEVVSKAIQYYDLRQTKPEADDIYNESLMNLKHQIQSANCPVEKITVTDQCGYRMVKVTDLIFLQTDSNYTIIQTPGSNVIVSNQQLDDFERILADREFFKINKTTIINMSYVEASVGGDEKTVALTTGTRLTVSRKRLIGFREAMLRHPQRID